VHRGPPFNGIVTRKSIATDGPLECVRRGEAYHPCAGREQTAQNRNLPVPNVSKSCRSTRTRTASAYWSTPWDWGWPSS